MKLREADVSSTAETRRPEQSRARYPDHDGYISRDGVRVFYEIYGTEHARAIVLMPTWPIVHSRMWKAQIPYLSRSYRVVTLDPRGNGRSDRPRDPRAYMVEEYVADTLAVMDATETPRAVLVGLCPGVLWSIGVAVTEPERVQGIVALCPGVALLSPPHPFRATAQATFDEPVADDAGWAAKENRHAWLRDFRAWVETHSGAEFMLPEPHSTKQFEDLVAWGLETDAETLLITREAPKAKLSPATREDAEALCRDVRCRVLVVLCTEDRCQPAARAERLAELTDARMVVLEGVGHAPMGRHPVKVNLLIKEFADSVTPPRARIARWVTGARRPKKVLFLSSPIGLGHINRDVAIADQIRRRHPDVEIDWLTQHPATAVLAARDERIHPASQLLANESAHIESESTDHDLHVFQAFRRMDEILVANFMLFHDVLGADHYDLVVGDEAWDVDYFWHENPELKRAAFVWMTDFVGWLPMPDGGDREVALAADYNAQMVEHIARTPRLRDRSIFVGSPDDIVPDRLGPDLPTIRGWTEEHYRFCGYITGFESSRFDRDELRAELGYRPDELVCLVTVGGSAVGESLLRKVIAAHTEARRLLPGLRMIVVSGPRIDPARLPRGDGVEVHGHIDKLYRRMAACDLAVVQGGLTTTMELTALKVPFIYFPLAHHFEQRFHVRHRLGRYRAGRCMEYADSTPETIAAAMAEEIRRPLEYLDVETDGAAVAAAMIGELL